MCNAFVEAFLICIIKASTPRIAWMERNDSAATSVPSTDHLNGKKVKAQNSLVCQSEAWLPLEAT